MTPERMRMLRRIGLYAGFSLVVFSVAFVLAFPFDRVKDLLIASASAQNMDLEIGSAGPTFGVGMALKDIVLQTRPQDGSKPTRLRIEQARATISPLAQLRGEMDVSLWVEALGGTLDADIKSSETHRAVLLKGDELAMAQIPGVKDAINLPLNGLLDFKLDMNFPGNRNAQGVGTLGWTCAACVVGDGREKLKVANNPLLAEGLTFPKVRLGDFTGHIAFDKGVGKLQGVKAKGADGELGIEGEVRLSDPLSFSSVDLYVRFRMSDALIKSNDKIQLLLQMAESAGKGADGYFGFRLTGTLGRLNGIQWLKTSPFQSGGTIPGTRAANARPAGARAAVLDDRPTPAPRPAPAAPESPSPAPAAIDPIKDPSPNLPAFVTEPPPIEPPPPAAPEGVAPAGTTGIATPSPEPTPPLPSSD